MNIIELIDRYFKRRALIKLINDKEKKADKRMSDLSSLEETAYIYGWSDESKWGVARHIVEQSEEIKEEANRLKQRLKELL